MLKIAIQAKGRLNEDSLDLMRRAGIRVAESKRRLVTSARGFDMEVLYLRDDDIPQAVASGVADCGIVGLNEVRERGLPVRVAMPLGFGGCRLSVALPDAAPYEGPASLRGMRIATSYPGILGAWLRDIGVEATICRIEGSVEIAPAIGMADAIFDIVSSGATLLSNGLREVHTVLDSEAVLIASPSLEADAARSEALDELCFRFRSILDSRDMKYVLMNLPQAALPEAEAILPGMRSPTVLPLAQPGWCSLHAAIPASGLWDAVRRLKAVGAEGILVLELENLIR